MPKVFPKIRKLNGKNGRAKVVQETLRNMKSCAFSDFNVAKDSIVVLASDIQSVLSMYPSGTSTKKAKQMCRKIVTHLKTFSRAISNHQDVVLIIGAWIERFEDDALGY